MTSRKKSAELKEKELTKRTRKSYSSEEKIRIVLEGLQGETDIPEICRREGIPTNLYYSWSKDFVEAGKKKLNGEFKIEAPGGEVQHLRKENLDLKQLVAELTLEVRMLKKYFNGSV